MHTEDEFHNKVVIYSFFIIMIVILIHTNNVSVYGLTNQSTGMGMVAYWFEMIASRLWECAVPFFFLVSGYLFFRNFTWDKLRYKYKSRFITVVVPYILWCTIYYMYYVIVTHIPFVARMMNGDMVVALDLKTWFSWLWVDSYYVFWFLKSLMIMILLTPVIFVALKNRGRFYVGIIMLVLSAIASQFIAWWPFETSYLLGAYVGIDHDQCALKCDKKLTIFAWIGVILWVVTTAMYAFGMITWRIPTEIVLVCIWYAGDCFKYDYIPKWWVHISFFIYCLHDMILEVYEKIILKLFGILPIMALIDYIVAPVLTVLTIVGIAAWMKHFTPRVWKILTGGRG